MTKYILHGGAASRPSEDNKKFYAEIMKGLNGKIHILNIQFAKDETSWIEKFEEDNQTFLNLFPEANFEFELADTNTEVLEEQIKKANVILIKGGPKTHFVTETLSKVSNLSELFSEKVVAGISAGALSLSKYYYDGDVDKCEEGLGILAIKTICHWGEKRFEKLPSLKEFGEDIEIFKIPEERYIVIES